jgi:SAM-dependent methyltransferase
MEDSRRKDCGVYEQTIKRMTSDTPHRFDIQDEQYKFPYHHLVTFGNFSNYVVMPWGFEYYAYMTRVINLIKDLKPKSVLDVGCGEGKMILELAKYLPGETMKGIDLSGRAILFAQVFNYGNKAQFECRDIETIKEKFDVISLVETMEHIPDDAISHVVGNVTRCLNPDGRVIVTVPSVNFPVLQKHYRHYDIDLILKQFSGFKLESVEYMVAQGWLYKVLIRLSRKFCSFGLIRKILFTIAQKFLFNAKKDTGRHVVCVLKK